MVPACFVEGFVQLSFPGVVAVSLSLSAFPWHARESFVRFYRVLCRFRASGLLGGSWDVESRVISPITGVLTNNRHSYLFRNTSY